MIKIKTLLIAFFCISFFSAWAQENDSTETERFHKVDVPAEYPGGSAAFYEYIYKNFKHPKRTRGISGKIFVSCVVDSTGYIFQDSTRVVKGLGHGLDEEAVRVINSMPQWRPGHVTVLDKDVPMRIMLPITFKVR